jgi:replicative DNA helicase
LSEPLHDHAAERSLLAIAMVTAETESVGRARNELERERLTPEDFHHPAHQAVFVALIQTLARDLPPGAVLLQDALRTSEPVKRAGGLQWLMDLSNATVPGAAFGGFAQTIRDLSLRRRVFTIARRLAEQARNFQLNPADVLSGASSELAGLVRRGDEPKTLVEVLGEIAEELAAVDAGTKQPVLPTGIDKLDQVIGGLQPTLTIIGALPGVGKSALLATIARNVARAGTKVALFSLEDHATWLGWRLLSDESGITQFVMRHRRLNEYQRGGINNAYDSLAGLAPNVLLDDRVALSPQDVASTARDFVLNRGVKAIFVDHLGELRYRTGRKDRFDLDVAEGLSDLRAIAKQHQVPVVCATHLVREAEKRGTGEVKLSDFANSAAIERQARVALGLSRQAGSGRLTVTVLKQTNGKAGLKVHLDFHGAAAMVKTTGGHVEDVGEEQQEGA